MQRGGQRRNVLALDRRLDSELARKPGDKLGVAVGVGSAQPVVQMENEGNDSELGRQLCHRTQQRDRIRPAADSDADALARAEEAMQAQLTFKQLQHGIIIAEAGAAAVAALPGPKRKRSNPPGPP